MTFARAFVKLQSSDFTEKDYADVLEKMLIFIFREHKRYINVDAFARSLG
jgi:hypothetical protein